MTKPQQGQQQVTSTGKQSQSKKWGTDRRFGLGILALGIVVVQLLRMGVSVNIQVGSLSVDHSFVTPNTTTTTTPPSTTTSLTTTVTPVNCTAISTRPPVNIGQMRSATSDLPPYVVSFSWWDIRLRRPAFRKGSPVMANPTIHTLQRLLWDLHHNQESKQKQKQKNEFVFVDVGANVGFITNFGLAIPNVTVVAIDPISYDIAKLCEGYHSMIEKGYHRPSKSSNSSLSSGPSLYQLYHAAAGPTNQPNVTITRPSDNEGYFDQASLTRSAVTKKHLVNEHIPLITVDSIVIPLQQKVGLVKIDVQGNEYGVLQGMHELLSHDSYFPTYVFYEDSDEMNIKAGYEPGACQRLLQETYGYNCTKATKGDMLCVKKTKKLRNDEETSVRQA